MASMNPRQLHTSAWHHFRGCHMAPPAGLGGVAPPAPPKAPNPPPCCCLLLPARGAAANQGVHGRLQHHVHGQAGSPAACSHTHTPLHSPLRLTQKCQSRRQRAAARQTRQTRRPAGQQRQKPLAWPNAGLAGRGAKAARLAKRGLAGRGAKAARLAKRRLAGRGAKAARLAKCRLAGGGAKARGLAEGWLASRCSTKGAGLAKR